MVKHDYVTIPSSKVKLAIAKVLKDEGFIRDYESFEEGPRRFMKVQLNYTENKESLLTGLKRVSRPGLRIYKRSDAIPLVRSGLGVAIVSTDKGLLTDRVARKSRVGGEVLCTVF